MKKITKEEFEKLARHGKGSSSPVYNTILALNPDEVIVVEKKDWKVKYPVSRIANRIARKYNFQFDVRPTNDRSGWAVMRVK